MQDGGGNVCTYALWMDECIMPEWAVSHNTREHKRKDCCIFCIYLSSTSKHILYFKNYWAQITGKFLRYIFDRGFRLLTSKIQIWTQNKVPGCTLVYQTQSSVKKLFFCFSKLLKPTCYILKLTLTANRRRKICSWEQEFVWKSWDILNRTDWCCYILFAIRIFWLVITLNLRALVFGCSLYP